MIDFSAVSPGVVESEIEALVEGAKRHRFFSVMVPPCYAEKAVRLLDGEKDILVGTVIGFPSGANLTEIKAREAELAVKMGCGELDMVINVGALRSDDHIYVEKDIRAVVEKAQGRTVKVILEAPLLNEEQIRRGCDLIVRAGAQFVKTATGWVGSGTTPEHVALIKSVVGNTAQIKAAGGIRTLGTLLTMHGLGATRFGISAQAALKIVEEVEKKEGIGT